MLNLNALTISLLAASMLPKALSFTIQSRPSNSVCPSWVSSLQTPTAAYQRSRIQLSSTTSKSSKSESKTSDDDDDDDFDDLIADLLVPDDDFEEETSDENNNDDDDESTDLLLEDDLAVGDEDGGEEDYDLSLDEFVDMVCETPIGSLGDGEVGALRQIMEMIASEAEEHAEDDDEDDHNESEAASNASTSVILAETAKSVERLLYRMKDEWQAAVQSRQHERAAELQPNSQDFLLVMQAWEKTMHTAEDRSGSKGHRSSYKKKTNTNALPKAVKRVYRLFTDQQDLARGGIQSLQLTDDTCRLVLSVLSASRDRGMDRKIWEAFTDIQNDANVNVDAVMYGSVISALAKSRDRNAADRAESMLREAARKFPPAVDKNGESVGIGVDSFNVVLTAWAKSGQEDGPARAEKLIVSMDKLDAEHGELGIVKPNVSSFTSLIDAYAQTNEWEGVGTAEGVLNRLLGHYLEGDADGKGFEPNIASWTIVISAWARLSKNRRKDAAGRASRLLKRMESLHAEGRITFAPDAIAYMTVMNAFAYSKASDGPVKAEEILIEMHERYLDGDDSMKPSPRSIQNIIDAWLKSDAPNAVAAAELSLDRYEDLLEEASKLEDWGQASKELKDIYRSMLFGWAKRNEPVRAQAYLVSMMERGMEPDSFCFDKIIECNTNVADEGSMSRTFELFELMEKYRQTGKFKPNERVYTSFIRAMTKAKVSNLPYKANVILKRMQDFYDDGNYEIKPTVFTYNAILYACAESPSCDNSDPREAFKLAVTIFNELRSVRGGEPDHVSYGNMLRCANLLPEGGQKDAFISTTFQLCCDKGFVNSYVLRDLQYVSSEDLWRSLLQRPEGEANIERLPSQWSRTLGRRK